MSVVAAFHNMNARDEEDIFSHLDRESGYENKYGYGYINHYNENNDYNPGTLTARRKDLKTDIEGAVRTINLRKEATALSNTHKQKTTTQTPEEINYQFGVAQIQETNDNETTTPSYVPTTPVNPEPEEPTHIEISDDTKENVDDLLHDIIRGNRKELEESIELKSTKEKLRKLEAEMEETLLVCSTILSRENDLKSLSPDTSYHTYQSTIEFFLRLFYSYFAIQPTTIQKITHNDPTPS